jgi:hypothetical protein
MSWQAQNSTPTDLFTKAAGELGDVLGNQPVAIDITVLDGNEGSTQLQHSSPIHGIRPCILILPRGGVVFKPLDKQEHIRVVIMASPGHSYSKFTRIELTDSGMIYLPFATSSTSIEVTSPTPLIMVVLYVESEKPDGFCTDGFAKPPRALEAGLPTHEAIVNALLRIHVGSADSTTNFAHFSGAIDKRNRRARPINEPLNRSEFFIVNQTKMNNIMKKNDDFQSPCFTVESGTLILDRDLPGPQTPIASYLGRLVLAETAIRESLCLSRCFRFGEFLVIAETKPEKCPRATDRAQFIAHHDTEANVSFVSDGSKHKVYIRGVPHVRITCVSNHPLRKGDKLFFKYSERRRGKRSHTPADIHITQTSSCPDTHCSQETSNFSLTSMAPLGASPEPVEPASGLCSINPVHTQLNNTNMKYEI